MSNYLTRREFFSALAASVVAAGCPLPVGFPSKVTPLPPGTYETVILDMEVGEAGLIATVQVDGQVLLWRLPYVST